jgi:hypothetical protein
MLLRNEEYAGANNAMFRRKWGLWGPAFTASGRGCTEALSRGLASRSIAQIEWVQGAVCIVAPFASGRAIGIEWQCVIAGPTPVESTGSWR